MAKLLVPEDGYVFNTHMPVQDEFIERIHRDGTDSALEWLEGVKVLGESEFPAYITFCWESEGEDIFELRLVEKDNPFETKTVTTSELTYSLTNLKIGTEYLWQVNGGKMRSFSTLSAMPRFLRLDGAINVRDIGGERIKQGLVYRGSQPYTFSALTDEGKRVFAEDFKIRTQIDLRRVREEDPTAPVAGDGEYMNLIYRPYMEVFEEEHKLGICKIMDVFADESKYPIYVHCLGGADRTGMIALYLRAIVGESDELINTDYELTSISSYGPAISEGVSEYFRSRKAEYYCDFLRGIKEYTDHPESATISEAAVAFLRHCGVEQSTMDKIAAILIGA